MQARLMPLLVTLVFWVSPIIYVNAQIIDRPHYDSTTTDELTIEKVELTSSNTVLHMVYRNTNNQSMVILYDPFTYLKERNSNISHDLLRVDNITTGPDRVEVKAGYSFRFKLYFTRLSRNCSEFDLIECPQNNCFNILGVHISESDRSNKLILSKLYRERVKREYRYINFYDGSEWAGWSNGNHMFVFNTIGGNIRLYMHEGNVLLIEDIEKMGIKSSDKDGDYFLLKGKYGTGTLTLRVYDDGDVMILLPENKAYQLTN